MNKVPGVLFLALLRVFWLGIFAPAAVMFPVVAAIALGNFEELSLRIYSVLFLLLYVLVIIPSLVIGLLPLSVIDKKPIVVRFFYRGTIPILIGLLLLWVLSGAYQDVMHHVRVPNAIADTQYLIGIIVTLIALGATGIFVVGLVRSARSDISPKTFFEDAKKEAIECLGCSAIIPSHSAKCGRCGWSYKQ